MSKTFAVLLVAVIAACAKPMPVPPPDAKYASESGPTHRVTLTIPATLGAIGFVRARATYDMINQRTCVPMDYSKALGGRFNRTNQSVPLSVAKRDRTFVVDVPRNPFLNEDYYGLGVCNWELLSVDFVVDQPGRKMQPYVHWPDVAQKRGASLLCYPSSPGPLIRCFEGENGPPQHVGTDAPMSLRIE